jgi:hypothetical protein
MDVDWSFNDPDLPWCSYIEIKCLKPGGSLKMQEWVLGGCFFRERKVIDSGKNKSGRTLRYTVQFVPAISLTFTFGGFKWPMDLSYLRTVSSV